MLNSTFACMFVINWEVFLRSSSLEWESTKKMETVYFLVMDRTYGDFIGPGLSFIVTVH